MIFLYTVLYGIALFFIFPFEYFKRPKKLRKRWLAEKLGAIGPYEKNDGPVIWIHAVSVGEVMVALPLVKRLYESGYTSVMISTITDTGQQIAGERAPEGVKKFYLPFDLKPFINRVIRLTSPDIFMTMETELWPNLFNAMKDAGIPVFIFNGRISDRSFGRYMKIRFFLKKLFRAVENAGMQTGQDAERIKQMGMDEEKTRITGNFKFDIHGTLYPPEWVGMIKGTTIVAGSTHESEEDIIVEVYQRLRRRFTPLNLILAPRHPGRCNIVMELLKDKGIHYVRRSVLTEDNTELENIVILIDTIGELAGLYSVADVCIIGGSFVPVGGHNLFEAAYWSKPIICGPHMNNFPLTKDFMSRDAVRIADKAGLYDILFCMLESLDMRERLGKNAHRVFLENGGAVEKAMNILEPYLSRLKR